MHYVAEAIFCEHFVCLFVWPLLRQLLNASSESNETSHVHLRSLFKMDSGRHPSWTWRRKMLLSNYSLIRKHSNHSELNLDRRTKSMVTKGHMAYCSATLLHSFTNRWLQLRPFCEGVQSFYKMAYATFYKSSPVDSISIASQHN